MSFVLRRRTNGKWSVLPRSVRLTVDNIRIRHEALLSALHPQAKSISKSHPSYRNDLLADLLSGVKVGAACRAIQKLDRVSETALDDVDAWESEMVASMARTLKRLGIGRHLIEAACDLVGQQLTRYIADLTLLEREWLIERTTDVGAKVYGVYEMGDWEPLQPKRWPESPQVLVEHQFDTATGQNAQLLRRRAMTRK